MRVSKSVNGKKSKNVELYVSSYGGMLPDLLIEDGKSNTRLSLSVSQVELLIAVLSKALESQRRAA